MKRPIMKKTKGKTHIHTADICVLVNKLIGTLFSYIWFSVVTKVLGIENQYFTSFGMYLLIIAAYGLIDKWYKTSEKISSLFKSLRFTILFSLTTISFIVYDYTNDKKR